MFAEQLSDYTANQIPYRARYKAEFIGSQSELAVTLLECLEDLEAVLLDLNEPIRKNPIENRYELAAVLNEDLEFSLIAYWSDSEQSLSEVTFDLDSPEPIELPIDDVFLNPAKAYFPDIQLVYNFLTRPKVTTKRSEHRVDIRKNHEWIKDHYQEYKGRWVALQDGELLADAGSAEELLQQVTPTENTLLTTVY